MPVLNTADALYLGSTVVDAVYLGTNLVWPFVDPWGPNEHMYLPSAVTPQGPADPGSFSLGNKFTVLADGRITGVRTFHLTGSGPSRSASLWTTAGIRLATTTTTAEVNGWNEARFTTPVIVEAGEQFVVSWGYYGSANDGSFPFGTDFVMDGSVNLRWDAGMYSPNPSDPAGFPANPITPNHYYADVIFQEGVPVLGYAERIKSLTPLSYWRLGEPSGAAVGVDEMALYGVTYTGSPTLGVAGLITADANSAMQVSGVINQGASAGNPADYWLQSLTLEAWIKTSNAGASYRGLVVKQDGYGLFVVDNVPGVYEWAFGQAISSGVNIADGKRHHVVAVLQASGSQMYVDGVPAGPPFAHQTQSHAHPLTIGYATFSGQELTGVIDEVAIYGRALTAAEVAGNYAAGTAPATEWTPATIPGLGLWLEADAITSVSNGGVVPVWPDQGPNHYSVLADPAGPTWHQAGVNGKPSVYFNKSQRMLIKNWGTALSGKSEYTLFLISSGQNMGEWPVVLTAPTNAIWQWLIEYDTTTDFYWGHTNGRYFMYDTNYTSGQVALMTFSLPLSGPKFYKNGVLTATSAGSGLTQAVPSLGADVNFGRYYNNSLGLLGHVAAVLWYDHYLIDSERIQVEDYLKTKYGIT